MVSMFGTESHFLGEYDFILFPELDERVSVILVHFVCSCGRMLFVCHVMVFIHIMQCLGSPGSPAICVYCGDREISLGRT
jgi:hypothetical protein